MDIKKLIATLTLEEKAGICSGEDCWNSKAIPEKGIPSIRMCDGPSGLRFQTEEDDHIGVHASAEMVSYPTGCAMASSYDRDLMRQVGKALGEESHSVGVNLVLGPAANIKRTPLCGRNFEYLSEDPYLTGEMAAAEIEGIQGEGVGACMKHYACNNQETWRMKLDSVVDERTLREIYLTGFEKAVKQADPCALMASYNRVNGKPATENAHLLTEVLRDDWKFQGFVVSDWGAVNNKAEGIQAGMDLEMPGCSGITDKQLVQAVKEGRLEESVLDKTVERILGRVFRYAAKATNEDFDREGHHALATKAAAESAVLLKNEGAVLPLSKEKKVAFVGRFAENPRFQGGGSACVTPFKLTNALAEGKKVADIVYAQGFSEVEDVCNEEWEKEAAATAKQADTTVIFAGLPDSFESECYDRKDMKLPDCQNRVIQVIAATQTHVVVVLYCGSPVEMPWKDQVDAILLMHTGGQGVGTAMVDLLYGKSNPCGKLAETYPLRLEDTPAYLSYPGDGTSTTYQEGIFVGYRYYDKKKLDVAFPFGHGLSYTHFTYSNLKVSQPVLHPGEELEVSVDITNDGNCKGKEVVQLYVDACLPKEENWKVDEKAQVYVSEREGMPIFADRQLQGFEKVELEPGETKTVKFRLQERNFAWYDVEKKGWNCLTGTYMLSAAASSRDLRLRVPVQLEAGKKETRPLAMDSLLSEISPDEQLWQLTLDYLAEVNEKLAEIIHGEDENSMYLKEEFKELPLYAVRGIYSVTQEQLDELITRVNAILQQRRA